jgi:hypothetical protein
MDVTKPETTITLKRIEALNDGLHDFCFEIKAGTVTTFALTIPGFAEPNTEPNQMWLIAYDTLVSILHDAAKVAMERAQHLAGGG